MNTKAIAAWAAWAAVLWGSFYLGYEVMPDDHWTEVPFVVTALVANYAAAVAAFCLTVSGGLFDD